MRILITGATGFLGRNLVRALDEDGHDLVLCSRKAPRKNGLWPGGATGRHDWHAIDFARVPRPEDWLELLRGVDVVINAVGIFSPSRRQSFAALHDKAPRALFAACEQAGVRRVIQISALGADETATSAYHLSKKRADDDLLRRDLEAVVLRPSLIIGGEGESWRFFKALSLLPVVPVIGNGAQPLQPVAVDDVVRAVRAAMTSKRAVGQRIDIVGGENTTLADYLKLLSRWLGSTQFRPLPVPYKLAGPMATAAGLIDRFPLNRAAVSMLSEARYHNAEQCHSRLCFTPAGVTGFLQQHPPPYEERLAARHYFLRPLLRLSLGVMWIMAGIVSLFFYPRALSLELLAKLGLEGGAGLAALYGAAVLDIALGLALLIRFEVRRVALVQITLILGYTLALTIAQPSLWADPFGSLVKNFPVLVATMIMIGWERE